MLTNKSGDWSYCPACGGGIDTGYECGKCGRDWLEFHETRQTLVDRHAALRARITILETALQRSSDDNLEYLQCQPGCNSYGHDEHCAVANPRLEFDRLRAELAVYDAVAVDRDGTPFAAASAWRAECNRLRAENERLRNPLEHADYFTPQLVERDKQISDLRAQMEQALTKEQP